MQRLLVELVLVSFIVVFPCVVVIWTIRIIKAVNRSADLPQEKIQEARWQESPAMIWAAFRHLFH